MCKQSLPFEIESLITEELHQIIYLDMELDLSDISMSSSSGISDGAGQVSRDSIRTSIN